MYYIDHSTRSLNTKHREPKAAAVLSASDSGNVVFDLNCSGSPDECAGVRATFEKASEIITSALDLKSSLVINATYEPFCTEACDDGSMESIGQAYPTLSYIMVDQSDNMTRMYPQALLKQFTNMPVKPSWSYYDINAHFNSHVNWYFYNSPDPINDDQIDFLKNVLHELIHGLGFITSWTGELYASLSPLIDDLNHFVTPKLLAQVDKPIQDYSKTMPFWGFVEFPFDKLISANSSQGGFHSFSSMTQQLNAFYSSSALFDSAIDMANAWYASDQYKYAAEIYRTAIVEHDTVLMVDNEPIFLLETGLNPFSDGSTLCHVDLATNVNTSEYLMVYVAAHGATLDILTSTFSLGPLGPKLLQVMANLGYYIKNSSLQPVQPSLTYWAPSDALLHPNPVSVTHGPAHMPTQKSSASRLSIDPCIFSLSSSQCWIISLTFLFYNLIV